MEILQSELLEDLKYRTHRVIAAAEMQFQPLPLSILHFKPSPSRWSIVECLEHLNLYGDHYLPAIRKALLKAGPASASAVFRSGWLGEYFSGLMLGKNGQILKFTSPKSKNPLFTKVPEYVIERFLDQQRQYLACLEESLHVNLGRVRVPISIAPWIRIKLGDTLRFCIYHNERHIRQAERVWREANS
ncbi:MAG TPA: DinB family protein [Sphingobacteriaceae bacterium]